MTYYSSLLLLYLSKRSLLSLHFELELEIYSRRCVVALHFAVFFSLPLTHFLSIFQSICDLLFSVFGVGFYDERTTYYTRLKAAEFNMADQSAFFFLFDFASLLFLLCLLNNSK